MPDENANQEAIARLRGSVASITEASNSAEELIRGISGRIREATESVDTEDSDSVNTFVDELNELADQLDNEASELSSAVLENTSADPASQNKQSSDVGASAGGDSVPSGGSDSAAVGETREDATAAGGYNQPGGPPADVEPAQEPEGQASGETTGTGVDISGDNPLGGNSAPQGEDDGNNADNGGGASV